MSSPNRILIAVPTEQLTPELRAKLSKFGIKIIGEHCPTELLLKHLETALRLTPNKDDYP